VCKHRNAPLSLEETYRAIRRTRRKLKALRASLGLFFIVVMAIGIFRLAEVAAVLPGHSPPF